LRGIKSKQVRDSARGESCTVQIAGVCNYDDQTTILAHLPDESNGMGKKADDISACYACSCCHDAIDKRITSIELETDREWYLRRAMVRTWRRLVEKGVVSIKGVAC